jgi:hypothetical protein
MQWLGGRMVPAVGHGETFEGDDEDSIESASTLEAPRVKVALKAKAKPATPANVIQLARARLRDVEREIKRLRRLEKERDKLKRLLDAASNKPRAVVRDIKRSAG